MDETLPASPIAMPAATPYMPPAVQRRITIAAAHATENTARIAARMERQASLLNVLLRQCQTPAASRRERLARLRRLADAWAAIVAPDAACGPSCAHCCHIPVPVTRIEAEDLARAAKRPPATIDGTALPPIKAGYHSPCPFLRNGHCSVYASRPLACRLHFNLDVDALLCELVPNTLVPVPYADAQQLHFLFAAALVREDVADIRNWFPD